MLWNKKEKMFCFFKKKSHVNYAWLQLLPGVRSVFYGTSAVLFFFSWAPATWSWINHSSQSWHGMEIYPCKAPFVCLFAFDYLSRQVSELGEGIFDVILPVVPVILWPEPAVIINCSLPSKVLHAVLFCTPSSPPTLHTPATHTQWGKG